MPEDNANKDIMNEVLSLVYSSGRKMPAHFTSCKDRSQSFCIEFELLSPEDDLAMASEAWYFAKDNIIKDFPSDDHIYFAIVKIGEDIMISSYIFSKKGYKNRSAFSEIFEEIISNALEDYKNIGDHLLKNEIKKYFNHCQNFGCEIANN